MEGDAGSDIGWGFYEELMEIYYSYFDDDDK